MMSFHIRVLKYLLWDRSRDGATLPLFGKFALKYLHSPKSNENWLGNWLATRIQWHASKIENLGFGKMYSATSF